MGVTYREKVKGSRVWWVFVAHNGRRQSKRVGDRKAAKAVAEELERKIAQGAFHLAQAGPTFAGLAAEWLEKYPLLNGISETTLENYRSFTEKHLVPYFGDTPVSAITMQQVEDFIAAKRTAGGAARWVNRGLSEGSVRSGLIALRLILDRAVKAGHLAANPALRVGRFPVREEKTVDPFTVSELRSILVAAQAQDAAFATMLRLWTQTGMRAGEVAGLRWGDLDLEKCTATVQRTYSRGRIGPTKTRRSRAVSLLHPVAEDTPQWKPGATVDSRAVLLALRRLPVQAIDPEAYVFVWREGRPWHPMAVLRAWQRALRAAGVRYRSPEQLRHTFASTMLSRNAPLLYVQRQGGWRSAAVLLRVYARWMPQEFEQAHPAAPQLHPAPDLADAK